MGQDIRSPIRALVIGAGPTADLLHLPRLAQLRDRGELVLSFICDLQHDRADAARRKFGFEACGGDAVAALALPDIDAVYLFGSAQLHHGYGLQALRRGRHLFVEKPIAPSYAEALELARTAEAHGLIAVGGHNRRFHPPLVEAHARAGAGGWRYAEAAFHKPEFGRPPPFGARTWLSANGVHALDALVFVMGGLPEQVLSLAGPVADPTPAAFSALMRWPDGAQVVFRCDNHAGGRREEYAFHGLGESFTVTETSVTFSRGGAVAARPAGGADESFAAEHAAFLQAIRSGESPPHSLAALAPSLFLLELIEAGFCGPVHLPRPAPSAAPAPVTPAPVTDVPEQSVLVCGAMALQPALGRRLGSHRLVSLDDVLAWPGPRPDIVAAILGRGAGPLPAEVLDKLPGLKVVGVMGLSLARFEPEALLERGVVLVNASAAYAETVAEFALGLAILGRRRAFQSHALMRKGGWGTAPQGRWIGRLARRAAGPLRPLVRTIGLEAALLGAWRSARPAMDGGGVSTGGPRDLGGAVVGLIGWGANARAFAVRLRQAGARVRVWSEHAQDADLLAAGATPASLTEVLAADIVSLHRGLTPRTLHALGSVELDRLRPGTVLINLARGALIEPNALLARLRRGDIFACLDSFEDEPLPARHPLRRLPNVFLTAHIAGGSPDMHAAAADEVVGKVADWLGGLEIDSVSADQLRTMT